MQAQEGSLSKLQSGQSGRSPRVAIADYNRPGLACTGENDEEQG